MTDSNPTAALPGPVAEYVRACNAFDADALSAVFAEDALVNDIRREFRGRPAIRRWLEREADGHVTLLIITHNSPAPAWSRS